jgi:hypothetical protein
MKPRAGLGAGRFNLPGKMKKSSGARLKKSIARRAFSLYNHIRKY